MPDCDWLTLESRIVALLDRRVESVHVDVNDLAISPFVHLRRLIV
jgi:pentose-5-phosphate-3-epimerase